MNYMHDDGHLACLLFFIMLPPLLRAARYDGEQDVYNVNKYLNFCRRVFYFGKKKKKKKKEPPADTRPPRDLLTLPLLGTIGC